VLTDLLWRLRSLFRRNRAEVELDVEIGLHLELEAEKYVQQGYAPEEARRRARIAFGGVDQTRDACRDAWGIRLLEDTIKDLRYTGRVIRRNPGFTTAIVLSLALGIGANLAIFSVWNALLIKSLPVPRPEQLVEVTHSGGERLFSNAMWEEIRNRQDVFGRAFAYSSAAFNLSTGGEKRLARGLYVSGDYFTGLGVRAVIGRTLTPVDDQRGVEVAPSAVLSNGFWQREYGGDHGILGRTITLDNRPFHVVGVIEPDFFGLVVGERFDIAVPLSSEAALHPAGPMLDSRTAFWLNVAARLKPEGDLTRARAGLLVLARTVFEAAVPPGSFGQKSARPILDAVPAATGSSVLRVQYGTAVTLLLILVAVLLLVACANIANLLLARAAARQRELMIRIMIGAGRGRLVRQLLTESLIISVIAALLGLAIGSYGSNLLVQWISSARQPSFLDLSIDVRVIGFAVMLSILTGVAFGLAPVIRMKQAAPVTALQSGFRSLVAARGRWWMGHPLVAGQIALSLILLITAGLFVRSLHLLTAQDTGFESEGVLLVDADLRSTRTPPAQEGQVADELLVRFRSIPGILAASRSAVTPIRGSTWQANIVTEEGGNGPVKTTVLVNYVASDYFRTMATAILAGRDFARYDTPKSPHVAIANETAVRKLFRGVNPIGRSFRQLLPGKTLEESLAIEIVGVAKDAKYRSLREEIAPTIYMPIMQSPFPLVGTFELRYAGPLRDVTNYILAMAGTVDRGISLDFRLLRTQVSDSILREQLIARLSLLFAVLAVLLGAGGLHSLLAYTVARRRKEIGIRMAVGASRHAVAWLMIREVMPPVAVGLAVGFAVAVAGARLVRSLLYGLTPLDPVTVLTSCILLAVVGAAAVVIPARRAAMLDPNSVLREE
jgi:putative ABC transport system permease protein